MSLIRRLFTTILVAVGMVMALPAVAQQQEIKKAKPLNGEFSIMIPDDKRMEQVYMAAADALHETLLVFSEAESFGPTKPDGEKMTLTVSCDHTSAGLENLLLIYSAGQFQGRIIKNKSDTWTVHRVNMSPSHKELANLALSDLVIRWKQHQERVAMIAKAYEGAPKPNTGRP